jgi:predicted transcriptional regulator
MTSALDQILISLDARHAENILQGKKLVELRRRPMKVPIGSTVWIYAKLPVGSIVGCASVSAVRVNAPATLWRKFGGIAGISRSEFFTYFSGINAGTALELTDCRRLKIAIPLESLRRTAAGFHPPQFFVRLKHDTPLLVRLLQVVQLEAVQAA